MTDSISDHNLIRAKLDSMAHALELHPPGTIRAKQRSGPTTLSDLRRARRPGPREGVLTISLVERHGLVYWELGAPLRPELRRTRRAGGFFGTLIARKEVAELEPNQITGYLETLDSTLTPKIGVRKWTGADLVDFPHFPEQGNILLFIHGTFSNSDHIFAEMRLAPNGADFLNRAVNSYDHVLAFDHPTLSASPFVNALDLRTAVGDSKTSIDIVCHSRGGLVSRWWMEKLDPYGSRIRRAVFVGSPLSGTSLASPGRLRAGLKVLSTYASLLGNAAMAAPLLTTPAALLRIFGSVAGAAGRLPLIDAGVAMIPGLNGQSRVSNAAELVRLNSNCGNCPSSYFFISSNFNPEKLGWIALKAIREIGVRSANLFADMFVFPGDNDLVVDTVAMTEPWGTVVSAENILTFDEGASVHHTAYFQQRKTLDFIARSLVARDFPRSGFAQAT